MRNDAARRSSGRMQLHRQRQTEKIIEKPDIKVVDGRLTSEVLEAFGRISEAVPSRWQKGYFHPYLFGYRRKPGNAEVYVMNADGSDTKRLTKPPVPNPISAGSRTARKSCSFAMTKRLTPLRFSASMPTVAGEKRLSDVKNGIECFEVSPDGKSRIRLSDRCF